MKNSNYILEITVFLCGAVVMIYELVGSRILGPYFGTSIFVWASLIGIILGSLSLGYYVGGKISDKKPSYDTLSLIVLFSAIFVALTLFFKSFLLVFLQSNISDFRISLIIAALILFMPTSFLMGIVSPYTVKLKLESMSKVGVTVGNLYAISTAGSIFGTFLSGFYLIPTFGTNKLLIILTIILVIVSLALSANKRIIVKATIISLMIVGWFAVNQLKYLSEQKGFIDIDTAYNRIWIYDTVIKKTGQIARTMGINNENHSSMILNSNELINEYTKYYHLAKHFNPDFKQTLMLGGGGYSFPKDFLLKYPAATMDVVEIDPKVTELAKKYFNVKDDSRLIIYNEDGRVYLNKTAKKYDVIFGDAFGSRYSLPYQLTTKEAVQEKYNILNDQGVVILNIISAIEGDGGKFLRAEYATYKSVFPSVYLFPVQNMNNGTQVQNIMLVAIKTKKEELFTDKNTDLNNYLQHSWKKEVTLDIPILTDDFAPVDHYISKTIF